ncbi:MAG: hypothetical protein A3H28_17225 [Acidobacteria bacterium RIFCSPLOWO2_02_FULL_61_28]|nr:MAG: hypothetical protein A3H28_17225 [Acidobacteria bacterium RIFCSPLOWO2_02_FULL_61_28]
MAALTESPARSAPAELVAYIDGGSRGNPGPAGFGVLIQDARGRTVETVSEFLGETTNNVAEYRALLAALEYATERQTKRLTVYCDSELVVRQMQGHYRVQSPGLKPLHQRAQDLARRLAEFTMKSIPREQNSFADRLANEAMDRGLSRAQTTGETSAPVAESFTAIVREGKLQPLPPLPHLEEGAEYEVRARKRNRAM